MQYENEFNVIDGVHVILASLKSSSATQTALKMDAPGTGTPPKDQRLLMIATPKQVQHIHIHAKKGKC